MVAVDPGGGEIPDPVEARRKLREDRAQVAQHRVGPVLRPGGDQHVAGRLQIGAQVVAGEDARCHTDVAQRGGLVLRTGWCR